MTQFQIKNVSLLQSLHDTFLTCLCWYKSLQNPEWMDQNEEAMNYERIWFGMQSDMTTWAEWLGITAKQEIKE